MKSIVFIIITFIFILISCNSSDKKISPERIFDINVNLENDFINIESTRKQYNSHSGEYYSGVDSINQYGAGYVKQIEDTLKGFNLKLIISAWLRESNSPGEGSIAISVNKPDGTIKDWNGLKVKTPNFKEKEWIHITDTFKYQADFLADVKEIKIFALKQHGKDLLDVDDLKIKYIFYK